MYVASQALHVGQTNFKVMQLLIDSHTKRFGIPTPTEVSLVPVPGKAILVSQCYLPCHELPVLYMVFVRAATFWYN